MWETHIPPNHPQMMNIYAHISSRLQYLFIFLVDRSSLQKVKEKQKLKKKKKRKRHIYVHMLHEPWSWLATNQHKPRPTQRKHKKSIDRPTERTLSKFNYS